MTSIRVLAVLAVVASARPASAHPLDLGYLRVEPGTADVAVRLDVDLAVAAAAIGARTADAAAVAAHTDAIADATIRRAPITTERGPCRWHAATAGVTDHTVRIAARASCPAGTRTRRWSLPFVAGPDVSPGFELLAVVVRAGGDAVATIDRAAPELGFTAAAAPRAGPGGIVIVIALALALALVGLAWRARQHPRSIC